MQTSRRSMQRHPVPIALALAVLSAVPCGAAESFVLLRFADSAGRGLDAGPRRAVADGLAASAAANGAIVCRQDAAPLPGSAAERFCVAAPEATPFWWDATLAVHAGVPALALLSLQLATGDSPPARAPAMFALAPVPLPADADGATGESQVYGALRLAVAASPDVGAWFGALASRPELPHFARLEAAGPAGAGPSPDVGVEAPARRPEPAGSAGGQGTVEAPLAQPPPSPQTAVRPAEALTFTVRQAVVGKGFGAGRSGRLTLSEDGIVFTANGTGRPDWTLGWQALGAARRDDGIWEVPFVVVLQAKDGSRRHLARIDERGRYVS